MVAPVRRAKPAAEPVVRARRGPEEPPRSLDEQQAREEQPDAQPCAGRQPFPQQRDADRDREQRGAATRQRVDDRQVAAPERRGEEREVEDLDAAGQDADEPGERRDRRLAERRASRSTTTGTMTRRGGRDADGRRAQRVVGGLEQDVPRRRGGSRPARRSRAQSGPHRDATGRWSAPGPHMAAPGRCPRRAASRYRSMSRLEKPQPAEQQPADRDQDAAPSRPSPSCRSSGGQVRRQRDLVDPVRPA